MIMTDNQLELTYKVENMGSLNIIVNKWDVNGNRSSKSTIDSTKKLSNIYPLWYIRKDLIKNKIENSMKKYNRENTMEKIQWIQGKCNEEIQ